jgi:predicted negative regulator of RcsB-dependent stress response
MRNHTLVAIAVAVLAPTTALAQAPNLKTPEVSPAASVSQTVGITKLQVDYHRPSVNGRKVWGGIVPYGDVWRAGANENTTLTTSTAIKIGGKPLPAGSYGVHMIPTANDWTLILSKITTGWGSFSYDAKDDQLRVAIKPHAGNSMEERLEYEFEDVTDKSATLTLKWEKLAVPVRIDVDTPAMVMAQMRADLRGIAQFFPQPWAQAANYWATNGGNLDEAQKFADKSMSMAPTFMAIRVRAAVAEKKGDAKKAEALRAQAMTVATEAELNQFGYGLMGQKKLDEAIAIFQKNVTAHPQSWNAYDSLAEAYATKGDKPAALENYAKALTMVKDDANKKRITDTLAKLKKD